ncbi:hypothetical protein HK104_001106 [Borealophlyctis nickersoniae]|nr:hypothetical protein HK104_001106 [Borealophlyctis nickersoniae]
MARGLAAHAQRAQRLSVRQFSQTPVHCNLFTDLVDELTKKTQFVTAKQLQKRIIMKGPRGPEPGFLVLDVRESYEWNEDHIPGAKYMGRGNLEREIEKHIIDMSDEIVVYCARGPRSIVAADSLNRMGFPNVYVLKGGIASWKKDMYWWAENRLTYEHWNPR